MKQTILVTGLSGLVGSRIRELLQDVYVFEALERKSGVDITDRNAVLTKVKKSQAGWILHLAAKTNVDECEKDKELGKNSPTWLLNVEGTRNIVDAANSSGKKVIYISSDFVFDGTREVYREEDIPHPINWYGVTKYEGEKIVGYDSPHCIVRITYPYAAHNNRKQDFVHKIVSTLSQGLQIESVTDLYFSPTFIDDIAYALKLLITNNASGVYHAVGASTHTPFEAINLIAEVFDLSSKSVIETTREKFYQNRAPRPYKLSSKNDKITTLGAYMSTFYEGLATIKEQGIL